MNNHLKDNFKDLYGKIKDFIEARPTPANVGLAIVVIISLILIVMQLTKLASYPLQANSAPIELYKNKIVQIDTKPNNPVPNFCGEATSLLIAPPQSLMDSGKHNKTFEDMLYQFEGDRIIIKLPKNVTQEQAELLIYAYNVAKKDKHRDPAVLQGIIWQESRAGNFPGHEVAGDEYGLKVGKRYYGVGQIKVNAARDVFERFPKDFTGFYKESEKVVLKNGKTKTIPGKQLKTDEFIIAHLIIDKKFNIRVASKYLWMVGNNDKRGYKRPTNFGITAYNQGVRGTAKINYNTWHYTVAVNKYRNNFLKKFNKNNKTHLN